MTTMTSQHLFLNMHYYLDMARMGGSVVAGIGFIGAAEAPAPVTADGPQAPAPEQAAVSTPQQEGPDQPAGGAARQLGALSDHDLCESRHL